jgi:tetratricopeptide (TPR) repeat protein
LLLASQKRFVQAVREIELARDLDPLAPRIAANLGFILYLGRAYDRALEELSKGKVYFPDHLAFWAYSGYCYSAQGRHQEAIAEFQEAARVAGEETEYFGFSLAIEYARAGKAGEAEEWFERARQRYKSRSNRSFGLALVHGALGRMDDALAMFEKAVAERDMSLPYFPVDARFDRLRSDPRFASAFKKFGR